MDDINIAQIIMQEGGIIGKDILPVPHHLKWKSKTMGQQSIDLQRYGEKPSISEPDGAYRFVVDPQHNQYFMIKNNELGYKIANRIISTFYNGQSDSMPRWQASGLMYYNTFTFEDPVLCQQFESFKEYTAPEAVAARRAAEIRAENRERQIKIMEQVYREKPSSVMDVIRNAGFTPRCYIELKNGMNIIEDIAVSCTIQKTVKLPEVSDLDAKYYIFNSNGVCMIGDGKTAILTTNIELINEFQNRHYEWFNMSGVNDCPFYIPSGINKPRFADEKLQQEWEFHLRAAETTRAQINRAMYRTGSDEITVLEKRRNARMNAKETSSETVNPIHWLYQNCNILSRLENAQSRPPDKETEQVQTVHFQPVPVDENTAPFIPRTFSGRAA